MTRSRSPSASRPPFEAGSSTPSQTLRILPAGMPGPRAHRWSVARPSVQASDPAARPRRPGSPSGIVQRVDATSLPRSSSSSAASVALCSADLRRIVCNIPTLSAPLIAAPTPLRPTAAPPHASPLLPHLPSRPASPLARSLRTALGPPASPIVSLSTDTASGPTPWMDVVVLPRVSVFRCRVSSCQPWLSPRCRMRPPIP